VRPDVDALGDDADLRVQAARRDGDEEIGLIRREAEEDPARPLEPGLEEDVVLSRVALNIKDTAEGGDLLQAVRRRLDNDEGTRGREEFLDDRLGRLVAPADDVVVLELGDVSCILLPGVSEPPSTMKAVIELTAKAMVPRLRIM
jgi:hypothetical protein